MRSFLPLLVLLGCGAAPYPGTLANGIFKGVLDTPEGVKNFGFAGDLQLPETVRDGPPEKLATGAPFATTRLEFDDRERAVVGTLIATYEAEIPVGYPITLNWALRGGLGAAMANLTGVASVTTARWTDNPNGVITFTADLAGKLVQDSKHQLETTAGTLTWSGPRAKPTELKAQSTGPYALRTGVGAQDTCPADLISQFAGEGPITYGNGELKAGGGRAIPCKVFSQTGLCGGNFNLEAAGCKWAVIATGIPAAVNPATNSTLLGTVAGYAFASDCIGTGLRKTCQF